MESFLHKASRIGSHESTGLRYPHGRASPEVTEVGENDTGD